MSGRQVEWDDEDAEIVDGEIVAEFGSETLLHLPKIPEEETPKPAPDSGEEAVDSGRRRFIARLLIGGTGALALGGGAALLLSRQRQEPTVVVLPNGVEVSAEDCGSNLAMLAQRVADLEYQLASRTAERDQCLSQLNETSMQVQQLQAQLEELQAKCQDLQSLNNLWQALDDVGLDYIVRSAVVLVGNALTTMLSVVALLQAGLGKGQSALDKFVSLLPGPRDGIRWLRSQISVLSLKLEQLSEDVQDAVQPTAQFATLIANFVLWVLDRLPFGAGDKARAGLESIQAVVSGLPDMVEGINASVLNPLATWFGSDNRNNFTGILIGPVTDHLIKPAQNTLEEVARFESAFRDNLVNPVEEALAQRDTIRAQIEELQTRLERWKTA